MILVARVIVCLLLLAGLLWWLSRLLGSRTNLASSAVLGSDVSADGKVLYSQKYNIYGKPDYIVSERFRGREVVVAVELKPTRHSRKLYESDEMQALAYALLLQEAYPGKAAPYARVSYAPGIPAFQVDVTPARIARLEKARDAILAGRRATSVARSHAQMPRCRACGFRKSCSQSLA